MQMQRKEITKYNSKNQSVPIHDVSKDDKRTFRDDKLTALKKM